MAMTVRLPEDLDRRLETIAAAEHVSKHALLLRGAQLVADRSERRAQVTEAIDFVTTHDAELLQRLADA
jgi:predicted transcriptional regulator